MGYWIITAYLMLMGIFSFFMARSCYVSILYMKQMEIVHKHNMDKISKGYTSDTDLISYDYDHIGMTFDLTKWTRYGLFPSMRVDNER